MSYEKLKAKVQSLRAEGIIDASPSREERADWAYGTTVIENGAVTMAMALQAAEDKERNK